MAGMEQKKKKRKRRKKKMSGAAKFGIGVLIAAGILLMLALIVLIAYFWMDSHGKSAFAEKQEAVPEQMQQAASASDVSGNDADEALEAGSIRYNGKTYAYKSDVLTFLCMGIDKTGEVKASKDLYRGGQADALFLAVLDPGDKKINIIGINRDTMTEIKTFDPNGLYAGKEVAQIALAHAYGEGLEESCENTVEAVSNLFYGLPIHGYCALNMSVISTINDAVGGVEVTIPESLAGVGMKINGKGYGYHWSAGDRIHLQGEEAYVYIKYRDTRVAQSADERLIRQKTYLQGFVNQAKAAVKQDMTLPLKLYTQVLPYMVTDISADEAVYLAGQALSYSFDENDIYTMEGHVEMGEVFEEFYQDDTALYELILKIFYDEVTPPGTSSGS